MNQHQKETNEKVNELFRLIGEIGEIDKFCDLVDEIKPMSDHFLKNGVLNASTTIVPSGDLDTSLIIEGFKDVSHLPTESIRHLLDTYRVLRHNQLQFIRDKCEHEFSAHSPMYSICKFCYIGKKINP